MFSTAINNRAERGSLSIPSSSSARERDDKFLRHFGFSEMPFGVTPDPAFLFSSRMHRAALQSMIQSIESNLGFTVLLGGPGMGKTTLLLQLLTQYRSSARTAFIFQTQCKRYELLRFLAWELELPVVQQDDVALHQSLKEMLVNEARVGRKVLILIDEAQNLRPPSLEAIRLLSDFETPRAKLLHIILAGSAQLGETLLAPELSPLSQRCSTVCRLEPLTPQDVSSYVTFRLNVAGCRAAEHLFSPEALAEVGEQSDGIPRVINSICYRALGLAHVSGERRVSAKTVRQAASDLDLAHPSGAVNPSQRPFRRTESRTQLNSDPFLEEEEEKRAAPDLVVPDSELRDAERYDMPFRPAASPPVAEPANRPLAAQAQAQKVPEALPRENLPAEPNHLAPDTNLSFKPHKKYDPWTVILTGLILLAVGFGVGWHELQVRSSAAGHEGDAVTPIAGSSGAQNERSLPSDTAQIYSPNAIIESNANSGDRRRIGRGKSHAPIVEDFSQNLVPSKIRPQSETPVREPSTAAVSTTSQVPEIPTVPVETLSKPSLATPQPKAHVEIAEIEESEMVNESTEYPNAPRQPVKTVKPRYPKDAELKRIEGDVILELHVNSRGIVDAVRTVSGDALLGDAAREAAWQWRFTPSENESVSTVTRARFNFKLPIGTNQ